MKKLNRRQIKVLGKHAEHHSAKHMKIMKDEMRKGKTFTEAHNKAMNEVGN